MAAKGVTIREMVAEDVDVAADICYESFNTMNAAMALPPEWPPKEVIHVPKMILQDTLKFNCKPFVAVDDATGAIIGSNALHMADDVVGVGPISVKEGFSGVGRMLMKAVMQVAEEKGRKSVRLMAVINNTRSVSLYLSLGFSPMFACMHYEGMCTAQAPEGFTCRLLAKEDVEACGALHAQVRGTNRGGTIAECLAKPHCCAVVALDSEGQVAGYSTGGTIDGHSVAKSEAAMQAVVVHLCATLAANHAPHPCNVFVPYPWPNMMRWCSSSGFRLAKQVLEMSYGPDPALNPDTGVYFPSIQY